MARVLRVQFRHTTVTFLIVGATVVAQACGGGDRANTNPGVLASPTAPSGVAAGPSSGVSGAGTVTTAVKTPAGGALTLPAEISTGASGVAFPGRDESFDFRANYLEQKYRTGLNRTPGDSYADVEGAIVWTQEYLRYRLGQCPHEEAVTRVFDQIEGRPAAPLCGQGIDPFPSRVESLNFRLRLEDKYRNHLNRQPVQTAVDAEGDVVWTQEYLRYRTNGCSQAETVQRIDDQIGGKGVQPTCFVPGQPYGPNRSIGFNEAFDIIVNYHNRSGADLGRNSTRESRVQWFFSAAAIVHYGHPVYNPNGGDRNWCVKDAGGGRPPSDDVIVRCDSREAWDLISGAGANGYSFDWHSVGRLGSAQNVYPPPLGSLPR